MEIWMRNASRTVTMLEGNVWKRILTFALPLLIGNLFQQLYNIVDSVVVGNFIGKEALAAVGSSNSLINLIIGLFMGIATGSGVLIAQYFGAKEEEKMQHAVHTAISLSIIGGILLIAIGILVSPILLRLMGTPERVMGSSILYLRIFFCGSLFNILYNMGAGILRAVGDSKNPLYYLTIACFVNTIFNLLFVVVFGWGVAGSGIATVIAQGLSAFLVLRKLMKSEGSYKLYWRKLRIDARMTRRILSLGIPSGLQSCIIALSNVIVQANINHFGEDAMAGCSSYMKIDGFVILPVLSFSMAAMTFVGQNVGAGKLDRVKKGVVATVLMSAIYVGIVSIFLLGFGQSILRIFSQDTAVNFYGWRMLCILIPFYLTISITNVLTGAFRGAGKSTAAMLIMVGNLCGIRMIWVNVMTPIYHSIDTVLWGYPISWITGIICCIIYAKFGRWLKSV
ncbi:MAG TPA: MATE family efflux transporter [Lachnospiraceae bacterium]|nr:MATE family efflux transporter [Lachnospiraceae bacterium]